MAKGGKGARCGLQSRLASRLLLYLRLIGKDALSLVALRCVCFLLVLNCQLISYTYVMICNGYGAVTTANCWIEGTSFLFCPSVEWDCTPICVARWECILIGVALSLEFMYISDDTSRPLSSVSCC
jgi:hypothetical protein